MHELSIVQSLAELATEAAQSAGALRVQSVRLRLGALSGGVEDALHFSWEVVIAETLLAGAQLRVEAALVVIEHHLVGWDLTKLAFLFIENVGNLVCPSSYDLGEDLRLVFFAVAEGEDKPLKYPPLFSSADMALITKIDLAEVVEFERTAAYASLAAVCPHAQFFETSAKTGAGLQEWIDALGRARQRQNAIRCS